MGLKEFLFGARPPAKTGADASDIADDDIGIASDIITIPSRDFFGMSCKSPNGRYTIAWCDGGPDQARRGRWIFLDAGKVVAEGDVPRPNEGKVADNGVFIINDWGAIETLSGTLKAFAPDGRAILRRSFKANLYNNALSRDGRWALCQTANGPGDDGNRLFVFDLASGAEVSAWQPESGWASGYEFAPDGSFITLIYPDGGGFRYSVSGAFVDRMRWLGAGLQKGDIFIVEKLLDESEGSPTPELIQLLLSALDTGIAKLRSSDAKIRARALRLRGICFDAMADPGQALQAYDEALALDPKVGVKRRAEQLRKNSSR